jgi:undecaprenyl pyrophosphate phosphatase UppP
MEHANGCVVLDLSPFLMALGCFMMLSGICLQWLGPKAQQKFMIFIVRMGTFLIICSFEY